MDVCPTSVVIPPTLTCFYHVLTYLLCYVTHPHFSFVVLYECCNFALEMFNLSNVVEGPFVIVLHNVANTQFFMLFALSCSYMYFVENIF